MHCHLSISRMRVMAWACIAMRHVHCTRAWYHVTATWYHALRGTCLIEEIHEPFWLGLGWFHTKPPTPLYLCMHVTRFIHIEGLSSPKLQHGPTNKMVPRARLLLQTSPLTQPMQKLLGYSVWEEWGKCKSYFTSSPHPFIFIHLSSKSVSSPYPLSLITGN